MRAIECPNLCPTCPTRQFVEGEPRVMANIGEAIDIVPVDLVYGQPTQGSPRRPIIGIIGENDTVDYEFIVTGHDWESGKVRRAIEYCEGPTTERYGFLYLKKRVGCTAIDSFKNS